MWIVSSIVLGCLTTPATAQIVPDNTLPANSNVTPGVQWGTNQPKRTIDSTGNLTVGQDLTFIAGNLNLKGQLVAGRNLTLQAEDTVKGRDSSTRAFIASTNGNLLVQGNQIVDIFALNHPDTGLFSSGNMVHNRTGWYPPPTPTIHFKASL